MSKGSGDRDGDRDAVGCLSFPTPVLTTAACMYVCSQSSMLQLVESGRYDTRENFSVVLQPLFRNAKLPILEVCSPYLELERENCSGHLAREPSRQERMRLGRMPRTLQMLR